MIKKHLLLSVILVLSSVGLATFAFDQNGEQKISAAADAESQIERVDSPGMVSSSGMAQGHIFSTNTGQALKREPASSVEEMPLALSHRERIAKVYEGVSQEELRTTLKSTNLNLYEGIAHAALLMENAWQPAEVLLNPASQRVLFMFRRVDGMDGKDSERQVCIIPEVLFPDLYEARRHRDWLFEATGRLGRRELKAASMEDEYADQVAGRGLRRLPAPISFLDF